MARKKEYQQVSIQGIDIKCQICGHDKFWHRTTLMNTVGMSFFNLDWANKEADNYVCEKCGYVHWFLK